MDKEKYLKLSEGINKVIYSYLEKYNQNHDLENVITVLINKAAVLIAMHLIKINKVKRFTMVEKVAEDFAKIMRKEVKEKYQETMILEL